MPPIWAVSCSGSHCENCHCELDLWPSDLKSKEVIWESWSMYLWSFMILGVSFFELSSGNHFTVSSHCDLDLWPSELKINRGHLAVMTNVPLKFHDPRRKRSWVIIRKPFSYFKSTILLGQVTVTFDLVTWKSIGVICRSSSCNVPLKFRDPRPKRSWVIIQKPFYCFRSLWPWPLN